jgi:hypothetical protein
MLFHSCSLVISLHYDGFHLGRRQATAQITDPATFNPAADCLTAPVKAASFTAAVSTASRSRDADALNLQGLETLKLLVYFTLYAAVNIRTDSESQTQGGIYGENQWGGRSHGERKKITFFPTREGSFNPVPGENKTSDAEFPRLPPYKYHPGQTSCHAPTCQYYVAICCDDVEHVETDT